MFKKKIKNLTTGKAIYTSTKMMEMAQERFPSHFCKFLLCHITLLRDTFYTWNVKSNEIECSIIFHARRKSDYWAKKVTLLFFSQILYMVEHKWLVFLPDRNIQNLPRNCDFIDTIINRRKIVLEFDLCKHQCLMILVLNIWKMC